MCPCKNNNSEISYKEKRSRRGPWYAAAAVNGTHDAPIGPADVSAIQYI